MFEHLNKIRFLIITLIVVNHLTFSAQAVSGGIVHPGLVFNPVFESTSPLLAILSGFLFFYGSRERFDYREKLGRRFFSLVLPYLFWSSLYLAIHATMKPLALLIFGRPLWGSPDHAFTLAYLARAFFVDPIVPNYWYLQNLIAILPFCWLIQRLLRLRALYILLFCGILLVYSFNPFPLFFHKRFLPYFLVGAYLGYHRYTWNLFASLGKNATNLLLLVTLLLPRFFGYENGGVVFKCLCVFSCASLFAQSFKLGGIPAAVDRFLAQNERHSFIVFCTHWLLISLVGKGMALALPGFLFRNFFCCLALHLALLALVLATNLWIARRLERHLPAFWNFLVGYRHASHYHS